MNDTALPGKISILENADRSVFPEMNDRVIIIFENESADSIGQSALISVSIQKGICVSCLSMPAAG
jgi:hypothetical protein